MKKQIELLRFLEELDMNLKDVESPKYQADFKVKMVDFLKSAEKKRGEISARIEPRLLGEYKRIKKRYGGRVVVQVINEFCGGCYAKLPSELTSRERTEVLTCPNCGRFLYLLR